MLDDAPSHWQPSAGMLAVRQRAHLLKQIRAFFAVRGVLEVETPLLASSCAPEAGILPFATTYHEARQTRPLYLQSSPELAMKRLLAAGSGPIFQINRAFRDGESGRLHNPEFTLLEWYRPGFKLDALLKEINELLRLLLGCPEAERRSYASLFIEYLGLDPLICELHILRERAAHYGLVSAAQEERDTCLQFLMSSQIEPRLGQRAPVFVYDYPASQAALAQLNPRDPRLAERFEVYYKSMELANGFHELRDANEQRQRFQQEQARRERQGQPNTPLDEYFLAALEAGMPDCCGVALGVDRLLMLMLGAEHIDEVLSFPLGRI